jgi:hypothetical protein
MDRGVRRDGLTGRPRGGDARASRCRAPDVWRRSGRVADERRGADLIRFQVDKGGTLRCAGTARALRCRDPGGLQALRKASAKVAKP